jgi:hypothetical protein
MRRIMFIGGAAAVVLAAACSDSTTSVKQPSSNQWSGAVIEVAAANPNARGELHGVVYDSMSKLDPSTETPIPGATVVLNLKIVVPAGSAGNDTAYTTVTKVGEVLTDANGRFLVTSIPEGDYYIVATPPDQMHYANTTWAFASSGAAERDAVIYLPRKLGVPPVDTVPTPVLPTPPPTTPPVDSL